MTRVTRFVALGGTSLAMAMLAIAATPAGAAIGTTIVRDPWNVAQTTATVRKLADQYRAMIDQLAAARAQVEAMTSRSGQGAFLDGPAERVARRYMPDAWSAATDLHGTAGAIGSAADATRAAMDRNAALYLPSGVAQAAAGRPSAETERAVHEAGIALAVAGASEAMIDASARRRDTYEAFLARIDTAPDVKAATDLANRIAAETGLTQNELVRATAMQANVAALQELRLASATADSARAARRTRINLSGGVYAPAN